MRHTSEHGCNDSLAPLDQEPAMFRLPPFYSTSALFMLDSNIQLVQTNEGASSCDPQKAALSIASAMLPQNATY